MQVKAFTTNLNNGRYWQPIDLKIEEGLQDKTAIYLYKDIRGQKFNGFGGAFTEAAAYNWLQLSPKLRQDFMEYYFGPSGLRYTLGRSHINSCDFSLDNYACVTDPEDEELQGFQTDRDEQYLFPMIKAAGEAAGKPIQLMLSPWSPPAFMKTNGDMNHGGQLKPEYRERWAKCIVRYIQASKEQGFTVKNITVQNEPAAVQTWDSCIYSPQEEAEFASSYLLTALKQAGLADIDLFIWDHNKELMIRRMQQSLAKPEHNSAVDGVAFHWYTGDHFEALEMARSLYPDKQFYFTEGCVEYSRFDGMTDLEKAEMYAHDICGDLNGGTNGSLDWNLLLDSKGGPNHVGNFCEAPIMCTPELELERKGSYYYIGHFSRAIQPGATRIGLSRWCSEIEATAFENPDGSIAVVLLNRSDRHLSFYLCVDDSKNIPISVDARSIMTLTITQ